MAYYPLSQMAELEDKTDADRDDDGKQR